MIESGSLDLGGILDCLSHHSGSLMLPRISDALNSLEYEEGAFQAQPPLICAGRSCPSSRTLGDIILVTEVVGWGLCCPARVAW